MVTHEQRQGWIRRPSACFNPSVLAVSCGSQYVLRRTCLTACGLNVPPQTYGQNCSCISTFSVLLFPVVLWVSGDCGLHSVTKPREAITLWNSFAALCVCAGTSLFFLLFVSLLSCCCFRCACVIVGMFSCMWGFYPAQRPPLPPPTPATSPSPSPSRPHFVGYRGIKVWKHKTLPKEESCKMLVIVFNYFRRCNDKSVTYRDSRA